MKGLRFGRLAAVLLAAALGLCGCASEGIDSRRRDGSFTVSYQEETPVLPADQETQPAETPSETQPPEPSAGENPEGEPGTVENPEGEPSAGENPEGETPAGENPEGEPGTVENPEGELSAGENPEGEPSAGENPEGEPSAGENPEGEPGTVENPEGEPSTGENPEGETTGEPETQPEEESSGLVEVIGTSGINVEELNQKDDTRQVAGYDPNDRDELNRPRKAVNFQEIFGKYNAEFLHGDGQTIMLNFAIGIDNDTIGPILDTLAARGIHAHFFVTGDYAKGHSDVIGRILGEGHILGSHSYAHPAEGMNYLSVEEIIDDSMTMQNLIREMYGYEMREYAFPSGFFSERALATVCQLGYHTVFYSFAYNDYMPSIETDADSALNRLLTELHPGAIYLLHGSSAMTAGVLGTFLDEAAARGYSFVY